MIHWGKGGRAAQASYSQKQDCWGNGQSSLTAHHKSKQSLIQILPQGTKPYLSLPSVSVFYITKISNSGSCTPKSCPLHFKPLACSLRVVTHDVSAGQASCSWWQKKALPFLQLCTALISAASRAQQQNDSSHPEWLQSLQQGAGTSHSRHSWSCYFLYWECTSTFSIMRGLTLAPRQLLNKADQPA